MRATGNWISVLVKEETTSFRDPADPISQVRPKTSRGRIFAALIAALLLWASSQVTRAADAEPKAERQSRTALDTKYRELESEYSQLQSEQQALSNYLALASQKMEQMDTGSFPVSLVRTNIEEINQVLAQLAKAGDDSEYNSQFDALSSAIQELSQTVAAPLLSCIDSLRPEWGVQPEYQLFTSAIGNRERTLRGPVQSFCPITLRLITHRPPRTELTKTIPALQSELSATNLLASAEGSFKQIKGNLADAGQSLISAIKSEVSEREPKVKAAKADLKRANDELYKLDQSQSEQQAINEKLSNTIYWVIVAIVIIYVALILGEREISRQLIQSRLVIELATMTFLLLTIIILGLSRVLDGTNLGTLIGAIAGYLLAQHGRGRERDRGTERGNQGEGEQATSLPGPLEIAGVTAQPGGDFQISYAQTGGENARLVLQWRVEGVDADFAHDTDVVRAGHTVSTKVSASTPVRFRTVASNNRGRVESQEKVATAQ